MTDSSAERKTVSILAGRLPEALATLEKLAKKARRYGCPDIKVSVGEQHEVTHYVKDWDGNERAIKLAHVNLIIEGEAPRYGNHEFLAHIELTKAGNLIDVRPGVEDLDPMFRESDGHCDHCHKVRSRVDVYAVRNLDTGEQLQIGRTCLRDYMGIDNPASIAHRFGFWHAIGEWEEDFHGVSRPSFCQSLHGVLSLTATCIRLFGWCSKGQAANDEALIPTSQYVSDVLFQSPGDSKETKARIQHIIESHSEKDDETAVATTKWAREEMADNNEYTHNLKVLFSSDNIHDERRLGIVISAVAGYLRTKEQLLRVARDRAELSHSQFVGLIGERLRDVKVSVQFQKVVGSNDFGEVILIKFADASGNAYSWFTGVGSGYEIGEECLLTGTVKKHNEYNGAKETVLARCKLKDLA
jgi:hypothetical protein